MDYKKEQITERFDEWLAGTLETQGHEWVKDNLDDLHHHAFNTDYFIIGRQHAIDWMVSKCWEIMEFVKDYEEDNFGELHTDLTDPERLVNMYAYIIGEQVVAEYREEQEAA